MSSFTPEIADVLKQAINDRLLDVHTSIPAKVVSYDPAKQRVNVQPVIKKTYFDDDNAPTVVEMPIIEDVPVSFPKGSKFSITHPVVAGDYCLLIFTEKSIEIWKRDGGTVDPRDLRKHHLSDCYALMGGQPETTVVSGATADKARIVNDKAVIQLSESGEVLITSGASTLKVTADGKFVINGAKDLLSIIDQFLDCMNTAQILTVFGPMTFLPPTPTTIAQLRADIAAIKG